VIDNAKARGLQEIFSAGRREALEPLAVECRAIAFEIAKKYHRFPRERREEIAHEATSRLIERYLKNPAYHVRSFSGILRTEVLHVVTGGVKNGRPCVEIERTMASIDEGVITDTRQSKGDERTYFDDLRTEHPEGDRIILDLYRATTFRAAVLRLSEYVDRRWLYDRSAKLRTVYKMTRRVKK
jgi:hypothetical protein